MKEFKNEKGELNESIKSYDLEEKEMKSDLEEIHEQVDEKQLGLKHIRRLGRPRLNRLCFEHDGEKLKHCIDEKDEIAAEMRAKKKENNTCNVNVEIETLAKEPRASGQKMDDLEMETSLEMSEDVDHFRLQEIWHL